MPMIRNSESVKAGYRRIGDGKDKILERDSFIDKVLRGEITPVNFIIGYEPENLTYDEEADDAKEFLRNFGENFVVKSLEEGDFSIAITEVGGGIVERADMKPTKEYEISVIYDKKIYPCCNYEEFYSAIKAESEEKAEEKAEETTVKEEAIKAEAAAPVVSSSKVTVYDGAIITDSHKIQLLKESGKELQTIVFFANGKEVSLEDAKFLKEVGVTVTAYVLSPRQLSEAEVDKLISPKKAAPKKVAAPKKAASTNITE